MFDRIPLPLSKVTNWSSWPFGGYGETIVASAARMLFVVLVFAGIAYLLRKLFGPGGRMRPKEFGTGHIAPRRERAARIKELRRRCKRGEMSMEQYLEESRRIREEEDGPREDGPAQ